MTYLLIILAVCIVILLPLARIPFLLWKSRRRRLNGPPISNLTKPCGPSSMLAVFGSGGHTKEMIALLHSLCKENYSPRIYFLASTDKFSGDKILQLQKDLDDANFTIYQIPRSREVNQSYVSSIFSTLYATLYTLPIVLSANPDLVLCNGPGTCIPICLWVFLSKVILFRSTTLVFVESICRVKTLSLSGKLVYYFSDFFIVQWPELVQLYPLATYIGRLL